MTKMIVLGIDHARSGGDLTTLFILEHGVLVEVQQGDTAEELLEEITRESLELADIPKSTESRIPYWRRFERKRRPR
jgi:hypothetical protein